MADFGYDVSNRTNIDPIFGTLDDFDQMVKAMHDKGNYFNLWVLQCGDRL